MVLTKAMKNASWDKVAKAVNSVTTADPQRTTSEVQKKWRAFSSSVREKVAKERRAMRRIGVGTVGEDNTCESDGEKSVGRTTEAHVLNVIGEVSVEGLKDGIYTFAATETVDIGKTLEAIADDTPGTSKSARNSAEGAEYLGRTSAKKLADTEEVTQRTRSKKHQEVKIDYDLEFHEMERERLEVFGSIADSLDTIAGIMDRMLTLKELSASPQNEALAESTEKRSFMWIAENLAKSIVDI